MARRHSLFYPFCSIFLPSARPSGLATHAEKYQYPREWNSYLVVSAAIGKCLGSVTLSLSSFFTTSLYSFVYLYYTWPCSLVELLGDFTEIRKLIVESGEWRVFDRFRSRSWNEEMFEGADCHAASVRVKYKGCRATIREWFMPEIERPSDATSARVTSFAQCHFCTGSSESFRWRQRKKKKKERKKGEK